MIVTLSDINIGSKRLSIYDFTLRTSVGMEESKFPKLGYPRSNNTTADHCGPREPSDNRNSKDRNAPTAASQMCYK